MPTNSTVTLVIDQGKLRGLVFGPGGALTREVARFQRKVIANAVQRAPVKTGNLRRSIQASPIQQVGDKLQTEIVTVGVKYAIYVHEGTGLYGKNHRLITPRKARAMKFEVDGKEIFSTHVKGVKARPFLRDALREVGAQDGWQVQT